MIVDKEGDTLIRVAKKMNVVCDDCVIRVSSI